MPFIAGGARTGIGKFMGSLSGFPATELGGIAIAGALDKARVAPSEVDYVIMGQVLQAGAGQITARQAASNAGVPMSVPAITINKVCLSGINAIYLADQMVRAGDADIVVEATRLEQPELLVRDEWLKPEVLVVCYGWKMVVDPRTVIEPAKAMEAYQVKLGSLKEASSLDGLFDVRFYEKARQAG